MTDFAIFLLGIIVGMLIVMFTLYIFRDNIRGWKYE